MPTSVMEGAIAPTMKIDFGDGVSALDRVMRTIVLMIAQATSQLDELGYLRGRDYSIHVHDEGIPIWIEMKKKKVFEIVYHVDDAQIYLNGDWTHKVKRRRRSLWAWLADLIGPKHA